MARIAAATFVLHGLLSVSARICSCSKKTLALAPESDRLDGALMFELAAAADVSFTVIGPALRSTGDVRFRFGINPTRLPQAQWPLCQPVASHVR